MKASLYLWRGYAQLCKPREDTMNNAITANAHEWERTSCLRANTRKKPVTGHRAASMQANLHVVFVEVERDGGL
jgi:hypothetical protein